MGLFDSDTTSGGSSNHNQLSKLGLADLWPQTQYYPYQTYACGSGAINVALKWSEVDYLRRLVAQDDKARTILNKLSPLIKVEVDF